MIEFEYLLERSSDEDTVSLLTVYITADVSSSLEDEGVRYFAEITSCTDSNGLDIELSRSEHKSVMNHAIHLHCKDIYNGY